MSTGTGLSAQFGLATETAFGTYTAPNRFLPLTSDGESIEDRVEWLQTDELGGGIFRKAERLRVYSAGAEGDTKFYVYTRGSGIVFLHCLGTVTTDRPDPTNKPNEYRHIFTPSTTGKRGLSATVQVGRPRRDDGTVVPHTYVGGKVTQFEISASAGEPITISTTWNFARFDHTKPLATPNYPTDMKPLTFLDATLQVGASSIPVREFSLSFDWSLETDAWTLGGTKLEPVTGDFVTIEGSLTTWYLSSIEPILTAFRTGATVGPLVVRAQYGEIDAGRSNPYQVVITLPAVGLKGKAPTVGGAGPIELELSFEALAPANTAPITIEYRTRDATP